jgi:putative intracellular protease/amidase
VWRVSLRSRLKARAAEDVYERAVRVRSNCSGEENEHLVRERLDGNRLFWIEDDAGKLDITNFIVGGRFKLHAVRDGNLMTGQQQYSGAAAARLIVETMGV